MNTVEGDYFIIENKLYVRADSDDSIAIVSDAVGMAILYARHHCPQLTENLYARSEKARLGDATIEAGPGIFCFFKARIKILNHDT